MASSTAATNATGTRQVSCETSDNQQIPVELDELLLSHTFTEMYDKLGLNEHEEFPGIFRVKNIESRVFIRVIDWCKKHKGQADPIVEKDAFTQEEKWFEFSDFELQFLSVPVTELLELVEAARFLEIRSLYEYGCQAIAALIKGKQPFEVREILQQACDLCAEDIDEIFTRSPWLGSKAEFQDQLVDIPEPINIPAEVIVTVFQKLPRADLERFQLVSRYFRNVIVKSSEHELSEKRGPLRPVDVTLRANLQDDHFVAPVNDNSCVICRDRDSLGKRLKFCTVRRLETSVGGRNKMSVELLASLGPLKPTWKNAIAVVSMNSFSSKANFEFAFTEVFMCKKLRICGRAHFEPQLFLRLPAILHCNDLNIRNLEHSLAVNDVVEWVEREKPKQWDESMYLEVPSRKVLGGFAGMVDALKKSFLEATRPNPYTVRIEFLDPNPRYDEQHRNEKTKEQLTIKSAMNGNYWDEWYISVERKQRSTL